MSAEEEFVDYDDDEEQVDKTAKETKKVSLSPII